MANYIITQSEYLGKVQKTIRLNDTFIPMDETNRDYQEFLRWSSEGNTPTLPEPSQKPPKEFLPLEFLDLFTESEQLAVVTATMTVPVVKLWYDRLLAASFISISDERTEVGLDAIQNAGLLTEPRKNAILEAMR